MADGEYRVSWKRGGSIRRVDQVACKRDRLVLHSPTLTPPLTYVTSYRVYVKPALNFKRRAAGEKIKVISFFFIAKIQLV